MYQQILMLIFVSFALLYLVSSTSLFPSLSIEKVSAQIEMPNLQNETSGKVLQKIENATSAAVAKTEQKIENATSAAVAKTDFGNLKKLLSTPFTIITAISEVPEIQVVGINFGDTDLTVTLKQVNQSNSALSNFTTSVTVIAIRVPVSDLEDILSLVKDADLVRNEADTNVSGTTTDKRLASLLGEAGKLLGSQSQSDPISSIKPFQLLKDIQLGTGSLVAGDWQYPRTVTMGLWGISSFFDTDNNKNEPASANLLTIFVVPYVGGTNLGSIALD
jgi:hypothetical protein